MALVVNCNTIGILCFGDVDYVLAMGGFRRKRERNVYFHILMVTGDEGGVAHSGGMIPATSTSSSSSDGHRRFPPAAHPEVMRAAEKDDHYASFVSEACRDAFRHLFGARIAVAYHNEVTRVYYPGLASHPEHELAKRQMTGFGGVVSFEIDGDLLITAKIVDSLKIPYIAPSFGGVESIVDQPAIMSYWDLSSADRLKYGIKENLIRFSFGVED